MAGNDDIKMSLKAWREDYLDDTKKLSELVRNLAFAGIGIIWIFKNSDLTKNIIPTQLILPLKFIVVALICDVSQYIWRAVNIWAVYKYKAWLYDNGKLSDDEIADVSFPSYIATITWLFFLTKIVVTVLAYYHIYRFLLSRIG